MNDKRFTIKPQDDYWAVVDNHNDDKVCVINGIHTEIEAIWLCDLLNEQQVTISQLEEEKGYWKNKAMTLLMQVRRLTPRMTDKEVIEFSKELDDE